MATKTKVVADNINMMNLVRQYSDLTYQGRIPEANVKNINNLYATLLNDQNVGLRNQFVNALIGQIMYQRVETCAFRNPLGILKKSPMLYGQSEQEIYVNFAKGYTFNMFPSAEDIFKFYESNVMSAFHIMSPPIQYAVSLSFDDLRQSFRDEYGIRSLINAKTEALVSGAEWDEYLMMKQLIDSAYSNGNLYAQKVTAPTDEDSGKAFTVILKSLIGALKFPNPKFNLAGATSYANEGSVFFMTTPEIDAQLSVDVLAYAFNLSHVDVAARKIIVDKFENPAIQAIVFDMRFFNVREQYRIMGEAQNPTGLYWNTFYTLSEMFSYSPFFPVIALTTDTVSVTSISTQDVTADKGAQVNLVTSVTGSNGAYVPKEVDYTISGQNSTYTNMIPGSNILIIGNDETASSITVTTTSRYMPTVTATSTVTISGNTPVTPPSGS